MEKLCKCGCNKEIIIKFHHKYYGIPDFIHGHNFWVDGNGSCDYWHKKAWKLFGQKNCEICSKSNEQQIQEAGFRLSMHCNSNDYTIMKRRNWLTTCSSCHTKYLDSGNHKN